MTRLIDMIDLSKEHYIVHHKFVNEKNCPVTITVMPDEDLVINYFKKEVYTIRCNDKIQTNYANTN